MREKNAKRDRRIIRRAVKAGGAKYESFMGKEFERAVAVIKKSRQRKESNETPKTAG